MLFILFRAHSTASERTVGNGGAGLEDLKQNVKFPRPDLFLIVERFLKVICAGGVFWLFEWIQGARKKYEAGLCGSP